MPFFSRSFVILKNKWRREWWRMFKDWGHSSSN